MPAMKKILYLCTGNSCRSQMAEGWTRHLLGEQVEVFSAGIAAHGLNPNAVKVMAEAGVDITGQQSETIDAYVDTPIDIVITVCGHAHETCPVFPATAEVIHHGFDDPPALAKEAPNEEAALECYRRVRDEIRDFVAALPQRFSLNA